MKNAQMMLLFALIAAAGGLLLWLAYLLVWRPVFLAKMIRYAATSVLVYFGCSLINICFSFLPLLWNKNRES